MWLYFARAVTVLWSIAQNKCATEMRYTALRGLMCAVSLLAVHNDNSPAESTLQVMVIEELKNE